MPLLLLLVREQGNDFKHRGNLCDCAPLSIRSDSIFQCSVLRLRECAPHRAHMWKNKNEGGNNRNDFACSGNIFDLVIMFIYFYHEWNQTRGSAAVRAGRSTGGAVCGHCGD